MDSLQNCATLQQAIVILNDLYGDDVQVRQVENDGVLDVLMSFHSSFPMTKYPSMVMDATRMQRDLLIFERRIVRIKERIHENFGHTLQSPPRSVDDVMAKYDHIGVNDEWMQRLTDFAEDYAKAEDGWDKTILSRRAVRTVAV